MIGPGRVIGLDLGSRRIGVAVSDGGQKLATGVDTVVRCGDRTVEHSAIAALVEEYEAAGVVIGVPISMSGEHGPAAVGISAEVEALRATLGVEVDTVDERLTTVVASAALQRSGRRAREQRPVIDRAAAAVLLQTWLDRRNAALAGGRP